VVVFVAIVPPYPTCPFWILVIALHQSQYSWQEFHSSLCRQKQ